MEMVSGDSLSRWTALRTLACLFLAVVSQAVHAQAMYRIKALGYLGGCTASTPVAYGFNASDEITGQACNANGDLHAFTWRNDGFPMVDAGPSEVGSSSISYGINASGLVVGNATDSTGSYGFVSYGNAAAMGKIPNVWGGSYTNARAVNDAGQVTGYADAPDGYHAFLWKNDGSPMVKLVPLDGFYGEVGEAINDSGQIAGSAYDGDRGDYLFFWRNDGTQMVNLRSDGGACCVNATGQIAGTFSYSGYEHYHAYVTGKNGTGFQDLDALVPGAMSYGVALNDSGQVAGYSTTNKIFNSNLTHAVVWMNDGTGIKDLGTLGGKRSRANDINATGQAVGWAGITGDTGTRGFIWKNDGSKILDLNALVDPMDPLRSYVTLTGAAFINNVGDVVATGTDSRTGLADLYLLQGTVLTLTPRTLGFGSVRVHASSTAKPVTVTNTSAKAVAITSVALTGPGAGHYALTNTCGASLAAKKTCAIKVTFKPTTKGAKTATLNVNGGGGGLRTVALTGIGT